MENAKVELYDGTLIYATPARAMPLERAASGPSRDDLLARALERAADPDFLHDNPPFFWRAEISSSRVDSYFTVMQDSTLRNFARDAEAGVPFQNSHNVRTLPFGASIGGRFHNGRGDSPARVESDFYTVAGLRTNEVSTDDLIRGIKAGIVREVSVGFNGGRTVCSLCSRDMDGGWLDYLMGNATADEVCMHFPGERYDVLDDQGKKTGEKALCLGRIEDASLIEVSAVYKGATPGAAVQKAQRAAEAGKLPVELARRLEARYRIALPASHRAWGGFGPGALTHMKKETPMPDPTTNPTEPQVRAEDTQERQPEAMPERQPERQPEDGLRAAQDEVTRLLARVRELEPLAAAGNAYREHLIAETLMHGGRAHGTEFPVERFRAMLSGMDLEAIQAMRDTFKATADRLVAPGPKTDATAGEQPASPPSDTPDTAFRTGR